MEGETMNNKSDMVNNAVLLCTIPHWFDEKILAQLYSKTQEPSKRTHSIMIKLAEYVFIKHNADGKYTFDKNVRSERLSHWRERSKLFHRFQKLSGMLAAYYADKLQKDAPSEKQRAEWEREEMYHLLVADEGRGIGLFINLINRASQLYKLSTFDLLLNLANEQAINISAINRYWIRFYEGELAWLCGDWKKSLSIWEALEEERELMSPDLAKTLANHLSFLYKDKGDWDRAIGCFKHSMKILEKADDQQGIAATFNNLGFLYKDKDQWEEADKYFKLSLEILKRENNKLGMAEIFNNQGLLYKDKGDWVTASKYFNKSLKIMKSIADQQGIAATLNNLGFLYKDWKKWEEADKYFRQNLKLMQKNGDELGMAAAFKNLGFLYTDRKKWKAASDCFQDSLEILEKVGDLREVANTYSYLGFLYRDKKNYEKADMYFQRGLEILNDMGDEHGAATVLNNLGLLYKHKGDAHQAIDYFQRSLNILEKVGDEMNAATALYHLALLYETMERYSESMETLMKVINICDRVGHPDLVVRRSRELLENIKKKAEPAKSANTNRDGV
jgi:tetratricopeptide (TPR) repeat protein